ncbi:hypothetical protein MMC11_001114 [Xylographa trunciseda]|nr:hypothetical protein [Xylographa trunciseda]
MATTISHLRSRTDSSSTAIQLPPNAPVKKKAPMTSWTRSKESTPRIFKPNHLGLETRDLKPGFRTMMKGDVEPETGIAADESEHREGRYGRGQRTPRNLGNGADGRILRVYKIDYLD